MVSMNDIYEELTQGYDVTAATASRIRGLIRDAYSLEIHLSGLGIFVEALPQPPYGICKVLGRFNSLLEAQNFAWAWLTGPYGVVRDVRFIELTSCIYGVDWEALVQDIRIDLKDRDAS